jgi:hypothetical protein
MKKATAKLGSISHGTMRACDLIPAFADELRRLRGALPKDVHDWVRAFNSPDFDEGDADDLVDTMFHLLNDYAPDYCYFGAHPGDGADYGFWLYEDWQQLAKDDGVLFVNDLAEVPDTFRGMLCVVNDHGNATLYATENGVGTLREIWSVV